MAVRKSIARKFNRKTRGEDATGKICLVLTTVNNPELADLIAASLIRKKLAACVNIVPNVKSFYRWKGKVESAEEFLLVIKTTHAKITSLEKTLKELHTYSVFEFIVMDIHDGSTDYLAWILDSVK